MKQTDRVLLLFLAVITLFHFAGNLLGWYYSLWWFDIPMHVAGGAWVGLLWYYIFCVRFPMMRDIHPFALFVSVLGFVALVGLGWEFYEFLADVFYLERHPLLTANGGILFDTMKDLFDDLIGATLMGLIVAYKTKKGDS